VSTVLLSGGSGGAKLARGLYEIAGEHLVVIANTGDDIEIYGGHVSPDPDLVIYWLADTIDARGWGIAGDTFNVMDGLRSLDVDVWFNLGDRDLAVCLERRRLLEAGVSLSETLARLAASLGVRARVLPMSERPVRTQLRSGAEWLDLQEFLIRREGAGPIDGVEFRGATDAPPTQAGLEAIAEATAIVIGPSNPVISIGPILALPGMRDAIRAAEAPVVAVSPVVGGQVLKGPTAACLAWAGQPCNASGVAAYYAGLIDGMVADEPVDALPSLRTDTLMDTRERRLSLAEATLTFADRLSQ
jgi:LPPG:FO 2-phospho-L-lactate transferase